uniref:Uncharacterized protein n=1 Tax=Hucho hucho TaxID=62062 RepID=A0A4W5M298_9TELE
MFVPLSSGERALSGILEVLHSPVPLSFDWTVVNTPSTIMSTSAVADRGSVRPVRGPGDGMETDKPPVAKEIGVVETPLSSVPLLKVASPKHSPKTTHPDPASPQQSPRASPRDTQSAPQPPGVLHLGKVPREACMVVEAVRIVVPRAAISRSGGHVGPAEEKGEAWAGQQMDERPPSPSPPLEDLRGAMEKLQNSERRLLQDKEGLLNQLHVQTEVGE